jgi:hypothetical protein
MVIAREAREIARQWVGAEAGREPRCSGAFLHGSITWLPDGAGIPPASDVDVILVLDDPDPPPKPGKIRHESLLLDVSYLSSDRLRSPEDVLGQYDLAGSLRGPSVIFDPSGRLSALQEAVSRDFAKRHWVERRCRHARDRILRNLRALSEPQPLHDQVTAWLFAAGVMTHVVLVAGLRNPTVRRRYVAVCELLADYGRPDVYERLLAHLGCAGFSRARVEGHLAALATAFDAATEVIAMPFSFASDISAVARPIAIDGSQELIARGQHREAVFWIAATAARCQKVFHHDTPPEPRERFTEDYQRLLVDLGIASPADLQQRGQQIGAALPELWQVAEEIIVANSEIVE